LDLSRRIGRGDIWRRQWERLENRVYNKPNDYSATGALAPGLIIIIIIIIINNNNNNNNNNVDCRAMKEKLVVTFPVSVPCPIHTFMVLRNIFVHAEKFA
jgi:hypothetical protein